MQGLDLEVGYSTIRLEVTGATAPRQPHPS